MSDLHRYGFAYGHPRCPLPPSKYDDPAKAEYLNHLSALRRQRPADPAPQSQSVPSAAPRISGDCRTYVAPERQYGGQRDKTLCQHCGGVLSALQIKKGAWYCSDFCRGKVRRAALKKAVAK